MLDTIWEDEQEDLHVVEETFQGADDDPLDYITVYVRSRESDDTSFDFSFELPHNDRGEWHHYRSR